MTIYESMFPKLVSESSEFEFVPPQKKIRTVDGLYDFMRAFQNHTRPLLRTSVVYKRKIDFDNFHLSTRATFVPYPKNKIPNRRPDYDSSKKEYSTSQSKYWYTKDSVIRLSDHWGYGIASCDWFLKGYTDNTAKWWSDDGTPVAGICHISNFEDKEPLTAETKEYHKTRIEYFNKLEPYLSGRALVKMKKYREYATTMLHNISNMIEVSRRSW